MDIVTDILVLSFPVFLLWKVRINFRQRLGLAVSLCLLVAMVIVAIVRIVGITLANGTVDIVWLAFWEQQECSISVIMVSVSAFRSFFVVSATNHASPQRPRQSPTSWRRRLLHKRFFLDEYDVESTNGLPQIPSATLTGMRTLIRETRISRFWSDKKERSRHDTVIE